MIMMNELGFSWCLKIRCTYTLPSNRMYLLLSVHCFIFVQIRCFVFIACLLCLCMKIRWLICCLLFAVFGNQMAHLNTTMYIRWLSCIQQFTYCCIQQCTYCLVHLNLTHTTYSIQQ